MPHHLIEDTKISIALTASAGAAATTDASGAALDMSGWDGVLVIVTFGAITAGAVTTIKMQQDTSSAMSGAADLEGTLQTIADDADDKTFYIDLKSPRESFVRVYIDRATQAAAIASATYVQYRGRRKSAAQGTNVSGESWHSPAEGTA